MYYNSKVNSISFMGVSNSEMLLSEKDLNAVEFNFLVKPATLEFKHELCQNDIARATSTSTSQDQEDLQVHDQHRRQDQDKFEMLVSTLKLKIPSISSEEELGSSIESDRKSNVVGHHDDDGFKTPTSSDHKIPAALKCPPAPRKSKTIPLSASMKRKPAARRRVLLDLSAEIESLFPPHVLADLLGGKIKKFRQGNDNTSVIL